MSERETAFLEQHLRQGDGREGRLAGRFEHDRAASGDRGCHLVGDEVQREVEGADGTDDADRHAEGEAELALSRRGRVERDHLAGQLAGLDGRELERADRTLGLDAGRADRLGGLLGDDPRELLDPLLQPARGGVEDLGSPPGRKRLRGLRRGDRSVTSAGPHAGTRPSSAPLNGECTENVSVPVNSSSPIGTALVSDIASPCPVPLGGDPWLQLTMALVRASHRCSKICSARPPDRDPSLRRKPPRPARGRSARNDRRAIARRAAPHRHRTRRARLRSRVRGRRPRRRRRHLRSAEARRHHPELKLSPKQWAAAAKLIGVAGAQAAASPAGGSPPPGAAPLEGARRRGDPPPLRRLERVLRDGARPDDDLLVRGLREAGRLARRRAGAEVRADLPQARPAAGPAAARRRVRLGRDGDARGQAPRRAGGRRHDLTLAGREGDASGSPRPAWPIASTSGCSTTATSSTGRTTRSARSACSSTSGWRSSASTSTACATVVVPGGRVLNHGISRPWSRAIRRSAVSGAGRASSTATSSPTASCTRSAPSCRRCSSTGLEVRHVESLREHYALTLRHWVANLEANWDDAVELVGLGRAKVWRLYMAASALNFEKGPHPDPSDPRGEAGRRRLAHAAPPGLGRLTHARFAGAMAFAYLDHPGPIPFAHRGGAGEWPENTMPAFEGAVRLGFRYVETDVHATADGALLAFHDDVLDRVTDHSGDIAKLPVGRRAQGPGRRPRADPAARGAPRHLSRPPRQHRPEARRRGRSP